MASKRSVAGVTGSLLLAWGALDVIGRIQTAFGLGNSLVGKPHWEVSLVLLLCGPFLIYYAVRSEITDKLKEYEKTKKEYDTKPAIWMPDDKWHPYIEKPPEPDKPYITWLWLRVMVTAVAAAVIGGICIPLLMPPKLLTLSLTAPKPTGPPHQERLAPRTPSTASNSEPRPQQFAPQAPLIKLADQPQAKPDTPVPSGSAPSPSREQSNTLAAVDRENLAKALFEFSGILDHADRLWGQANRLRVDDPSLAVILGKLPAIETLAISFENEFREARNKWNYYAAQVNAIFGNDPDNNATIVRSAIDAYGRQLDIVSAFKGSDETKLKTILEPATNQYNEAIMRFVHWTRECRQRLQQMRASIQ